MEQVREWLIRLDLEKYATQFEDEEYDSMDTIKSLSKDEIQDMITDLGLKGGTAAKIKHSLANMGKKEKSKEVLQKEEKNKQKSKEVLQKEEKNKQLAQKQVKIFENQSNPILTGRRKENLDSGFEKAKIVVHDHSNFSNNGTMKKVREWLISLDLEKYAAQFEEEEYDNMETIKSLSKDEIQDMITDLGLKGGTAAKIKHSLIHMAKKEKSKEVLQKEEKNTQKSKEVLQKEEKNTPDACKDPGLEWPPEPVSDLLIAKYVRFTPTQFRDPNTSMMQFSQMEFFDKNGSKLEPLTVASSGGNNVCTEGPNNLIDGNLATKFSDRNKCPVIFEFDSSVEIHTYRWATANDCPERDPVQWTLEGSDDQKNWLMMDNRNKKPFPTPENRNTYLEKLEVTGPDKAPFDVEKKSDQESCINLSAACEKTYVIVNQPVPNFLIHVSAEAIISETLESVERAAIDMVMVVDRSGSMKDSMNLVIETILFIISQLQPNDRLGIVTYNDDITTLLDLVNMDKPGKDAAVAAAESIQAVGGTNLCGGLIRGLRLMSGRFLTKNEVASILLFTDGQPTHGYQKKDEVLTIIQNPDFLKVADQFQKEWQKKKLNWRKYKPSKKNKNKQLYIRYETPIPDNTPTEIDVPGVKECIIHTFGFGNNHDAEMLRDVSDVSNGQYFYIKDANAIGPAFVECVGGLLSTVGQNLKLTCMTPPDVKLNHIRTSYPKKKMNDNQWIVEFKDIQAEESRDILVDVTLPKMDFVPAQPQPVLQAYLEFENVLLKRQEFLKTQIAVERVSSEPKQDLCIELERHRFRLAATDAIKRASQKADNGRLEDARQILKNTMEDINSSQMKYDQYVSNLFQILNNSLDNVQSSNAYSCYGSKNMYTVFSAAKSGRNAGGDSNFGSNKKKRELQSAYQSLAGVSNIS